MLYQLHWQFKDRTTEMRAQNEINTTTEMKAWETRVMQDYPLPKGAQWMLCNEKSEHFVWAVEK